MLPEARGDLFNLTKFTEFLFRYPVIPARVTGVEYAGAARGFSHLKVSTKLAGGFAAMILLTGLAGGAGTLAVLDLKEKQAISGLATESIAALQEASAARQAYLAAPAAEAAQTAEDRLSALAGQLAQLQSRLVEGDARRDTDSLERSRGAAGEFHRSCRHHRRPADSA
ncbi:hypothetical protein V6L77_18500 [Pannonibacter sp. Pt2-lr]